MICCCFGGKGQLCSAVLERAHRGIRQEEARIDVAGLDPLAALREIAVATFDHHVEHAEFIRLVMIENIHGAQLLKQIGGEGKPVHPEKTNQAPRVGPLLWMWRTG